MDLTILVKIQELADQHWYEHVKCKHKFLGSEYEAFKKYNISISIQVLAKDATLWPLWQNFQNHKHDLVATINLVEVTWSLVPLWCFFSIYFLFPKFVMWPNWQSPTRRVSQIWPYDQIRILLYFGYMLKLVVEIWQFLGSFFGIQNPPWWVIFFTKILCMCNFLI